MPLHRPTGPISLLGQATYAPDAELPTVRLKVVQRSSDSWGQSAGVNPETLAGILPRHPGESVLFELGDGSDCILQVRSEDEVPPGCIVVDTIQQHNMHLAASEVYTFRLFLPPSDQPFELTDLDAEVRMLNPSEQPQEPVEVDAAALSSAFSKQCFGRVLAVNELVGILLGELRLVVRITAVNTASEDEREELVSYHCYRGSLVPTTALFFVALTAHANGASESASSPESHTSAHPASPSPSPHPTAQGSAASPTAHHTDASDAQTVPTPTATATPPPPPGDSQPGPAPAAAVATLQPLVGSQPGTAPAAAAATPPPLPPGGSPPGTAPAAAAAAPSSLPSKVAGLGGLKLLNVRSRAERPPATNIVHVTTRDGEWFPVKKRLLRPCIHLTKHVRSNEAVAGSCQVDVDTLTFDRVLIFLEAQAMGRPPPQHWALHLLDDMLAAARTLGLRSLEDYCQERLGTANARISTYTFDQVRAANGAGGCWLVLDGMVLDVGRWLPEHPGGSTIIPGQALDMDCARFFEIYHASRESFLYLKDFYIGEVLPEERSLVPAGEEPPSDDFLQQLREFTSFRIDPEPRVFKSF